MRKVLKLFHQPVDGRERVPVSGSKSPSRARVAERDNLRMEEKEGIGPSLKLSHVLKLSRTRAQSVIGAKMNCKPSYSSFPRKDTLEEPSYRRRPVSRGANTNFERHHFQSHRFPFPETHTKFPESGNAMPHSAISTPSAVNPHTVIVMRGRESTRFNRLEYGSITAMTGLV